MSLPIAFNLVGTVERNAAHREHLEAIVACAVALKQAKLWRVDLHLHTDGPFADLQISQGRSLVSFMSDPQTREEVRLMMSLANQAPRLTLDLRTEVKSGVDNLWAAQAAYESDGLILSFPLSTTWNQLLLPVSVSQMAEDGELHEEIVNIENIYDINSCCAHRLIIECRGRSVPGGGGEIWERRADLFPHIRFLDRVQGDLEKLDNGAQASQVFNRLNSINLSLQQWRENGQTYPSWGTKITSESATRRPKCNFTDAMGVEHSYEVHARYTPGAGRIHFRVVDDSRTAEVAYIGVKIAS